jgi:arylsulfatase A-like enzyme
MLNNLETEKIENIVIFISDALRWDHTPEDVRNMGVTMKTIAASLCTPTSFATVFSGLYPPKHKIYTWSIVLNKKIAGIMNFKKINLSLIHYGKVKKKKSILHETLRDPDSIPLRALKPPFIYIEDDKGGHAPYGIPMSEFKGKLRDYFREHGHKSMKTMRKDYARGIEQSLDVFKERMSVLEERDLINNTLVIFSSDHGEMLGECGGLFGHNKPPCPELIYVPTVFIHPSLKPKEVKRGIFRHVDLLPTCASVLGKKISYKTDGVNILEENVLPKYGMNFQMGAESRMQRLLGYKSASIWDYNGGHTFHDLGALRARALFYYAIMRNRMPEFWYLKEHLKEKGFFTRMKAYKKGLRYLWARTNTYGEPGMNRTTAREIIDEYTATVGEIEIEEQDIDDVTKSRLQALGYID